MEATRSTSGYAVDQNQCKHPRSEPKSDSELCAKDIRDYVKMLPPAKRDTLVRGLLLDKDPQLRLKTLRQIGKARSAAQTPASAPRKKRRSVGQLSRAWNERDESG